MDRYKLRLFSFNSKSQSHADMFSQNVVSITFLVSQTLDWMFKKTDIAVSLKHVFVT